ncbi:MAG: ATP-binding cassette domain-containing protein [Myxococcota bacterium]
MIEVEGLGIERDGAALRDVSLIVAEGESLAVVGEDQAALTLLVRCCGGLQPPDRGRIRVAGVDITAANRRTLLALRRTVGYVSVDGGLLSNMTLRQNIELPMRYHALAERPIVEQRAAELLEQAGMERHADALASTVPAEIQKCAAYLRAVAIEPRVLLVEDPSALLHPRGRTIVRALYQQLRARGVSVLMTDDDVEFATELSDRQLHVEGDQIVPGPGEVRG